MLRIVRLHKTSTLEVYLICYAERFPVRLRGLCWRKGCVLAYIARIYTVRVNVMYVDVGVMGILD